MSAEIQPKIWLAEISYEFFSNFKPAEIAKTTWLRGLSRTR